jgi:hypothetical protein
MVYWFTPRAKRYTKNISVWYCRSFKTLDYICQVKQVSSLSHVISKEGISVDSSKIQNMLSWNAPTSDVDIHSSHGLVGYYRKFIEGF